MFKIVQTIERNKPVLSVVPGAWESDGILYWPKNKTNKLIKNKNSVPSQDWLEMSCTLERSDLTNYDEAIQELNTMCNKGDTTNEDEGLLKINRKKLTNAINLNDLILKASTMYFRKLWRLINYYLI